jgi:CHAD domain-containing protein
VTAAASGDHDDEAVHDYRVGLRRLRSSLRSLRTTWGKAALRPLEDELKVLADATGDVRDEEVLVETLGGLSLSAPAAAAMERWKGGRARRLRGARLAAARKLAGAELGGRLGRVLHRVERALAAPPTRPSDMASLRSAALAKALADVVERASATRADDVEGMHALRIRIKRLRYTIELLAEPGPETDAALKAGARLQKRLGELHDVDEAKLRMARAWGLEPAVRAELAERLIALRAEVARKAARDVTALLPDLEKALAPMIGG